MIKYVYLKDLPRITGIKKFDKVVFTTILKNLLDLLALTGKQVPSDLTDSNATYNDLISKVLGKYFDKPIDYGYIRPYDSFDADDLNEMGEDFAYRLITILNDTHERYVTILNEYASAKTHLMDNVTSSNLSKRKYNDTPQNSNGTNPYEGDDYISNFTSFDTTNSTEFATKMARLREIQEGYDNIMAEWVEEFRRAFMEENL